MGHPTPQALLNGEEKKKRREEREIEHILFELEKGEKQDSLKKKKKNRRKCSSIQQRALGNEGNALVKQKWMKYSQIKGGGQYSKAKNIYYLPQKER